MKKLSTAITTGRIVILLAALVVSSVGPAPAETVNESDFIEVQLFGPQQYFRTAGPPNVFVSEFQGLVRKGMLIILNGQEDGERRVASGNVTVNGDIVVIDEDFNQKAERIEVVIDLLETNIIEVELRGEPGNCITVGVTQNWHCEYDLPEVRQNPPAPAPEPVIIEQLPVPPTATLADDGSYTCDLDTCQTGCISSLKNCGSFIDNNHVIASVVFAGAPAAPDPASIYEGVQVIIIKTDGTTFSNGDPWKCLTCGIPDENKVGVSDPQPHSDGYPHAFNDGKRILWEDNIIDSSPYLLTDESLTPEDIYIYPMRWNVTADGSGPGGSMRVIRINPDDVHLGWNTFTMAGGILEQFAYYGRLVFNPEPTTGLPLAPRYDVVNVTMLYNPSPEDQPFYPDPDNPNELLFNPLSRNIGEFKVWTKDGRETVSICNPVESNNIDLLATDIITGEVRRLTADPTYSEPVDISPDNNWGVFLDNKYYKRNYFFSAMRGIPPLNDLITTSAVASARNNQGRDFHDPYLIDRYGDRGSYQGQKLNAGDGSPNSISDPNWNAKNQPWWSPDGTSIVYLERLVSPPACGGDNPLECPTYTADGLLQRIMIARLTSREPQPYTPPSPLPDDVPWGTPYNPGDPAPVRYVIPEGTWTLRGKLFGTAVATVTHDDNGRVNHVDVSYTNYSDDGMRIIDGTESADLLPTPSPFLVSVLMHSDLTLSGCHSGTKVTSEPEGFFLTIDLFTNIFDATGTLTTTIDGEVYTQPANGT